MAWTRAMQVGVVVVALTLSGCTGDDPTSASSTSSRDATSGSSADDPAASARWVDATLGSMTIEEKVGQLLVPRVHGTSADTHDPDDVELNREELGVDNAVELVGAYHVGGIIYFAENVTTPLALATFGNAVQDAASRQRVPVPVLTSMDQEQGNVVRVGPPATQFPGSMALAAGRSDADATEAARITGAELLAMGVFQDFAPVADVNVDPSNPVIGVRSFGSRPALVSSMVAAQVAGYQGSGIAATAKHFPGHGDTSIDSHTGLPVITHDRDTMRRLDLRPFRAAIAAGVDSIMTAHIQVPSLDPSGRPATLSKPIVTGLLRGRLGYDGVVITDSLRMEGVRAKFGDDRVPVLAILAGVDQLLDPPSLPVAYSALLGAVGSGEITIERLDESVRRILALKASLGLTSAEVARVDPSAVDTAVGTEENRAAAAAIADRTTTIVRNVGRVIPVDSLEGVSVLVAGWGSETTAALAEALRAHGAETIVVETGVAPQSGDVAAAVAAADGTDLVVAVTYDVAVHRGQATLVDALVGAGPPVVALGVGTPYDVAWLDDRATYVAAYSFQPVALAAFARVLVGEVEASGRLPVSIPSAAKPGTVLFPFGWPTADTAGER